MNWIFKGVGDEKQADVFVVPPTVGLSNKVENQNPENPDLQRFFHMAMSMQKGIYEPSCRVFAPYYRQVTVPVYLLPEEESAPYLAVAYGDVKAAFEEYFENYNCGRPFFLWGFSQGADMCLRLMKDVFADEKYRACFVAAYAVGWRLTSSDTLQYPWIKAAQGQYDTGCVICFNSETADCRGSLIVPPGANVLSINPLSWSTDTAEADKSLNFGARFFDLMTGRQTSFIPDYCGARIKPGRGTVEICGVDGEVFEDILGLGKGVLHMYDYMFFYENLRRNMFDRLDKFLSENRK